jgi:excisionase family DNA binding protein
VSKIIDIQAAADLLAVDYKTVYRLIQSGELPAAKIGRVYRLAQADVERYFAERKTATMRELRSNGRKRAASAAVAESAHETERACAWCGRALVLNYSVGTECAQPGCDATICRACAERSTRCPAHIEPGDRQEQVERLQADGCLVVSAEELRVLAGSFLADVAVRLDELSGWTSAGEAIARKDLTVSVRGHPSVEEWLGLDEKSAAPFEATIARRGRIRSGPVLLHMLVVPCVHRAAYEQYGFDVQPCTASDLRASTNNSKHSDDAVLAVWSPTGWTEQATETATAGLNTSAGVVPIDRAAGRCAGADGHLAYLFNPTSDEPTLDECARFIQSGISGRSGMRLETVVEDGGFHPEIAHRCFARLAATGEYVIDRFDDLGPVISRR